MRTVQLITSYTAAFLFAVLALRALMAWRRDRDRRAAHLALATGLYGSSQLISSISSSLYNSLAGQAAPRWLSIFSSVIGYLAIYAFILFLFDFIEVPVILNAFFALGTLALIVITFWEKTSVVVKPNNGGIIFNASPIPFRPYLYLIVVWFLVLSGFIWISFAIYGMRARALARLRMLSISAGFFVLFIVIGMLPLLLLLDNNTRSIENFATVLGLLLLLSAPLLFVGFTPPSWISRRYASTTTS